jgi:hypothetical protein
MGTSPQGFTSSIEFENAFTVFKIGYAFNYTSEGQSTFKNSLVVTAVSNPCTMSLEASSTTQSQISG